MTYALRLVVVIDRALDGHVQGVSAAPAPVTVIAAPGISEIGPSKGPIAMANLHQGPHADRVTNWQYPEPARSGWQRALDSSTLDALICGPISHLNGGAQIAPFNSLDDKDPDGVLEPEGSGGDIPKFQRYLDDSAMTQTEVASMADRAFEQGGFGDLGWLELQFDSVPLVTFAGLAGMDLDAPARALTLDNLRSAIDNRAGSAATRKPVFSDLSGFCAQSFHVRAAGACLVEAARSGGPRDQGNGGDLYRSWNHLVLG